MKSPHFNERLLWEFGQKVEGKIKKAAKGKIKERDAQYSSPRSFMLILGNLETWHRTIRGHSATDFVQ